MTGSLVDVERAFREHFDYVACSLRRLGVHPSDLEDTAHDVFIVVHRRRSDFDAKRPLRPLLFAIAVRVAAAYRRTAHRRHESTVSEVPVVSFDVDPESSIDQKRSLDAVLHALGAIADGRREVFILHELDGVSMPEIAEALEIPLNTGYSRLRLARREFEAAVERMSPEAGRRS